MPILANYDGAYVAPQKLWYLVDGVWKEVTNVYENAAQNELALLDQKRIQQDQVVASLQTQEAKLLAQIDGSDPTIPLETDPDKIDAILQQVDLISLQLDVASTEQVVLTKKLFEQKAQVEYLKLVTEGETALAKIGNIVTNVEEWGVIRIAPQSTLDERLEIAIQHGLDNNDRIFNYGLVYYRLYNLTSTADKDNIDYLKANFQRRMDNAEYLLGVEPTNYVFTIDNIQNVYTEVNQFVNSGAKRIEDYLASIKDQQKYILDQMEQAKTSMAALQAQVATDPSPLNVDANGTILTSSTDTKLQVPLGKVLLDYQGVDTFDKLVSTTTLTNIANGSADINDYPGIVQLNKDATSLNEKIQSIQDFQTVNSKIQNDIVTGATVFNLTVTAARKASLATSKALFWNSSLGDSTIANSGGSLTYTQTYTSSGTYRFKNNELVTLSTVYTAIINALSAGTCEGQFGVTYKAGQQPHIISVNKVKTYSFDNDTVGEIIVPRGHQTSIINANKASTATPNTEAFTKVNDKAQPHHSIIFVKSNTSVTTSPDVILTVTQPVINGLFYANTEEAPAQVTLINEPYSYALKIYPIHSLDYVNPAGGSFNFNAKEIPLTDWFVHNDNIINQPKELIHESSFSFNAKEIPLTDYFVHNDNIISQVKELITSQLLTFNAIAIPIEAMKYNDNIIAQNLTLSQIPLASSLFNAKQTNNYSNVKNGYGQDTVYTAGTSPVSLNGISVIKLVSSADLAAGGAQLSNAANKSYPALVCIDNKSKYYISSREYNGDYNRFSVYSKTRNVISSQTGLAVFHFDFVNDTLNKLVDSVPRMIVPRLVSTIDLETVAMDKLNRLNDSSQPRISTSTLVKTKDTSKDYTLDKINSLSSGVLEIATLSSSKTYTDDKFYNGDATGTKVVSGSQSLNKETSSIQNPALQINPGVTIS